MAIGHTHALMLAMRMPCAPAQRAWCVRGGHPQPQRAAGLRSSSSNSVAMAASSGHRAAAGAAMQRLNEATLSTRSDPHWALLKQCLDEAARTVFGGRATVHPQGSASKGTALKGLSDWDFMVRNLPTATKAQRLAFRDAAAAAMRRCGISYSMRLGENRISLTGGWAANCNEALPDADVIFQFYKADERLPPNPKALAHSHNAQKVVQYIKRLPSRFTSVSAPKSMCLEDAVLCAEQHLVGERRWQQDEVAAGADGFWALLVLVLEGVAERDTIAQTPGFGSGLQQAGMHTLQWRQVAQRVLNLYAAHGEWP